MRTLLVLLNATIMYFATVLIAASLDSPLLALIFGAGIGIYVSKSLNLIKGPADE